MVLPKSTGGSSVSNPYTRLLDESEPGFKGPSKCRRPTKVIILLLTGLLATAGLFVAVGGRDGCGKILSSWFASPSQAPAGSESSTSTWASPERVVKPARMVPRGVAEGVSPKSSGHFLFGARPFSWTNRMLTWERTAFHFQPRKNWMNDPNGPVFYNGWYHLFYQYNPQGAVWGNIVWGHSISKDLINWRHLPIAMVADQWYDANGVWTGSATILPDGQLVMLYTGSTNESVQVQNLAYPDDPSDPFLTKWVKYQGNPVLVPPPGIHHLDFRDPTTAWTTADGKWRIIIGSKVNRTGISLIYDTVDFKTYQLIDGFLHGVPGTGMWECVDFYPVSNVMDNGLDTSFNEPATVKHIMKASLDDDRNDYYAIGTYDGASGKWTPDDPRIDVGIGLRYDYGTFYASKTFYDQEKKRRILWGWITEMDSEAADIAKGWASLMGVPRTVLLDKKTGTNLLVWPVEEVENLRTNLRSYDNLQLGPGSILPVDVGSPSQLDIVAEFEVDKEAKEALINGAKEEYICSLSGGAAQRGALGPFGLLLVSTEDRSEQTPVYFYIAKGTDGKLNTFFCADQSRSSEATDVTKKIYGSSVPVLEGEKLSMRILVDHSIVESFAQGGRTSITSRVYPTKAVYDDARISLFNNATDTNVKASIKIWQMTPANMRV